MASKTCVFAIISMVSAFSAPAIAKQIVVADQNGWNLNLNFDYAAWSAGKEFHVGDTLVFNYKQGVHNVIKVNQTQFQNCDVSSPNTAEPLTTGNDTITLAGPGKKWYVCGVGEHCSKGKMKLAIDVSVGSTSAAIDIASSKFLSWMIAAAMAFSFMIMA